MQPDRRTARAALASAAAKASRNPDDPAAVVDRRRDYWATELEEHIRRVVDAAPPLTAEQRDRLVAILRTGDR